MGRALRSLSLGWPNRLACGLLCGAIVACGAADAAISPQPAEDEEVEVASSVNACPSFAFNLVLPKVIRPEEDAVVAVVATDVDSDDTKLSYFWSATSGAFAEPRVGFTNYRCSDSGPQVLSVFTSDPEGCESYLDLDVTCLEP